MRGHDRDQTCSYRICSSAGFLDCKQELHLTWGISQGQSRPWCGPATWNVRLRCPSRDESSIPKREGAKFLDQGVRHGQA